MCVDDGRQVVEEGDYGENLFIVLSGAAYSCPFFLRSPCLLVGTAGQLSALRWLTDGTVVVCAGACQIYNEETGQNVMLVEAGQSNPIFGVVRTRTPQ